MPRDYKAELLEEIKLIEKLEEDFNQIELHLIETVKGFTFGAKQDLTRKASAYADKRLKRIEKAKNAFIRMLGRKAQAEEVAEEVVEVIDEE